MVHSRFIVFPCPNFLQREWRRWALMVCSKSSNISIWMFSAIYSKDMIWCDSMMIYMMCKRTEHKVRGEVCYVRVHHQNQQKSPKQKLWWRKQENQEEKKKSSAFLGSRFWRVRTARSGFFHRSPLTHSSFSTTLAWILARSMMRKDLTRRSQDSMKLWHTHPHTLSFHFCLLQIRHLSGTVVSTCTTLGHVSSPLVLLVLVLVCATVAGGALGVEVVGGAGAGAGAVLCFCSGNASVTKLRVKFMWLLHATFPSFPTTKIQP